MFEDATGRRSHDASSPTSGARARASAVHDGHWQVALGQTLADVLNGATSSPDLLLIFVSSAYIDHHDLILSHAARRSGAGCVVGSAAKGVIGASVSYQQSPGISMIAFWLPGATITPVRLHQDTLDQLDDAESWFAINPLPADSVRGWLIFAEPYRLDIQQTLVRLRTLYPGIPMVGTVASTAATDRRLSLFFDSTVFHEGGVAVAIEGPYALETIVSQGVDPVGEAWTITSVDGNQINTISNRPAAEVWAQTRAELGDDEFDLLIGTPMSEYQDTFERGDFVVRGIIDVSEHHGWIRVGTIPRVGQTIQFQLRDPVSASEDVSIQLRRWKDANRQRVVGGLLSTCKGRGVGMFDVEDHDAAAIAEVLPSVPVAGMFSNGEIGPVRGVPGLNTFAMVLGLITRDD